ncbi:LOW QUALITY PROTEIN: hypothetical protein Bca4012_015648 [Brassica carinata]
MSSPSTGLAVLPVCDGEALDPPPPPPSIAPPPFVTKTHDSPSAAVNDSSMPSTTPPSLPSQMLLRFFAIRYHGVDVVATAVDVAQQPASSNFDDDELDEDEENTFVPSLAAWSKPLHFTPPPTPTEPATPRLGVSEAVKCQIDSFGRRLVRQSLMVPRLRRVRSCSLRKQSPNCL